MKLLYTTKDGRMQIELEADSQVDLWRELSKFQEVFEEEASSYVGDGKGGKKVESSSDIRYRVRTAKGKDDKGKEEEFDYFEKIVVSGPLKGFKKSFGMLKGKNAGLFPKPSPEGNEFIKGFNGWHKYNGAKKEQEKETNSDETVQNNGDGVNVPF